MMRNKNSSSTLFIDITVVVCQRTLQTTWWAFSLLWRLDTTFFFLRMLSQFFKWLALSFRYKNGWYTNCQLWDINFLFCHPACYIPRICVRLFCSWSEDFVHVWSIMGEWYMQSYIVYRQENLQPWSPSAIANVSVMYCCKRTVLAATGKYCFISFHTLFAVRRVMG